MRSWPSNLFGGRPGHRLQLGSGRRPSDRSMWHRMAWWAGASSVSLATCPNSELRRRTIGSSTGPRPVREETSVFRTWYCQRILAIWRLHFTWKASSLFMSAAAYDGSHHHHHHHVACPYWSVAVATAYFARHVFISACQLKLYTVLTVSLSSDVT